MGTALFSHAVVVEGGRLRLGPGPEGELAPA